VHDVSLRDETVTLKLPGLGNMLHQDSMQQFDIANLPYLRFLLATVGMGVEFSNRLNTSTFYRLVENDETDTLFDMRVGLGAGKGMRLARSLLLDALPRALRIAMLERQCGANMKSYGSTAEAQHTPKLFIGDDGGAVDSLDMDNSPSAAEELEQTKRLLRCLAPTSHNSRLMPLPRPRITTDVHLYNTSINQLQRQAVWDVSGPAERCGTAPYLLWGPPGTGKTTTLVEAILQVTKQPTRRILVCAPSDAACDVLALRLAAGLDWAPGHLQRISHRQRKVESLPNGLLSYSPIDMKQQFFVPGDLLKDTRVVVCTTYMAGVLDTKAAMGEYFTDCFVDECCQATEVEIMIPLLRMHSQASVTLAGDPRQLGPQLCSGKASEGGLGLSLLERLQALQLYKDGEFAVMTRLANNYRSHPALLQVPSTLFYGGQLRCCASEEKQNFCIDWEGLNGSKLPIMFRDVDGEHIADIDSPSFLNHAEIKVVVELCKQLCSSKNVSVKPSDIAVITPFRAQVLKCRVELRKADLGLVNVGQVEDFQGQESRIVIVSTVLTGKVQRWTGSGKPFGFMRDAKRFNVAMSRAESLCIVLGKKEFLGESESYWQALLKYCEDFDRVEGAGVAAMVSSVKALGLGWGDGEEDRLVRGMEGYSSDCLYTWRVTL